MEVINIHEEAFYALFNQLYEKFEEVHGQQPNLWIGTKQAMEVLGISSPTTLQQLRDRDEIRYSQPRKKIVRYYLPSLESYLEKHANYPLNLQK